MKKEKQPSPVKAVRKGIQESLLKELKNITARLQKDGITAIVDIEKEAKKLAKKITKGAKPVQAEATETVKEKSPTAGAKAPEKKAEPVKEKPAAKAPEAKSKKDAAPVAAAVATAPKAKTAKAAVQK